MMSEEVQPTSDMNAVDAREDRDASAVTMPQPPASEPPSPSKGRRPPSTLGHTLGSTWGSTSARGDAPSSPGKKSFNVTRQISKKYAHSVKEADLRHAMDFKPLDKLEPVHPDAQNMTRAIKQDLDTALSVAQKSGDEGALRVMMDHDDFKRRLQFLQSHTKSGQFVEHYGTQGAYDGDFLYGMRHGKGVHNFREESYDGEWKWDQRHGRGELSLPDGSKVKGSWQNGKPHGFTTMLDKTGTVIYEGEFVAGKRHGLGRQVFESGDMYDGGWADGRLHDRGVYYFANGDKLYGMWNKGLYDGIGVFHYADGSISRRVYKDGLLQSVQDWEQSTQRFGKTVNRDHMHKHTHDKDFPKDVFLLSVT